MIKSGDKEFMYIMIQSRDEKLTYIDPCFLNIGILK